MVMLLKSISIAEWLGSPGVRVGPNPLNVRMRQLRCPPRSRGSLSHGKSECYWNSKAMFLSA